MINMFVQARRFLFTLMAMLLVSLPLAATANDRIQRIEIQNNQRIEASTIESYLEIKAGDTYSEEKANESLKTLFGTGLFADVTITKKSNTLVVVVDENPVVNKIAFEGNKRLNDETLSKELFLRPRAVYTESKLQEDVQRIQSLYQKNGRFSVTIVPKTITLDQNRLNLVFEIDEGQKTSVQKIRFIGNEFFSNKALSDVISTQESRWYRFFSSSDNYDADRLAYDKELLRKFYMSEGFADFSVTSSNAEITSDKEHFIITFVIEEGPRYNFGKIEVVSQLPDIKTDTLTEEIESKTGSKFNADEINTTVENLTTVLNNRGYAFVNVSPDYTRQDDGLIMDVTYNIQEGPKVYVDRINVKGNVRTLDKVIRREIRLAEGDPFNASRLKRSRERIQNLAFFDKVDITNKQGSAPDKTDIDVEVAERSTGELNFGAGFSTTDGALGSVSVRERNLLGRGQDLRLSYQQSAKTSNINLGFTEPYFMDKDFSAGFDIFNITRNFSDESSFDSETQGFTLRGGYALTEYLRHTVYYSLQNTTVDDIENTASRFILEQRGDYISSMIGHHLIYDKRDNQLDPTEGYFAQISQEVAGLGGDSRYLKHEVKGGYYYPLYKRDVILSLRAKAGNIMGYGGKDVRINERFFIGGATIRGFKNAGIGPRDASTDDALGGKNFYLGTAEVMFPLGLPEELDFKGALFVDVGSLWDIDGSTVNVDDENSVRATVGAGIAWTSPLGPIRLDIGTAILKEDFDETKNIQFNFGTRF